jgi:hypothetical protein
MAKLTSKQRNAMPKSEFALTGGRFPINDRSHAIAAERLVGRAVKAGSISPSQASTVKRKAAIKLGTHRHKVGSNGFSQHSL